VSRPADRQAPGRYEIRIQGHLDEHWSAWFAGLTLIHEDDGTTVLRGDVTDQAQLHGLLTKVRDLGTALISVTPLDDGGPDSREQRHPLATDTDASP
jgi:hypothetical protein